ncbi:unnamed protein product, partial [Rotaria magnacalcarata]
MGAFLPPDVANMDESSLSLFGDQTKLSINDMNTVNEIERHISDKRFYTVILTLFAEDNTCVGSVVLFKGKGQVSDNEKMQYASNVKVFFTPKAFNNRSTIDKYVSWWYSKVNDGQPKLFITDSSSTHLNEETFRLMRKQRTVVAVIPKGSQSRILCTRLVSSAWSRMLNSIDPIASFLELRYVWIDNSLVRPTSIPDYCFDPTNVDYATNKNPNIADDQLIEEEA